MTRTYLSGPCTNPKGPMLVESGSSPIVFHDVPSNDLKITRFLVVSSSPIILYPSVESNIILYRGPEVLGPVEPVQLWPSGLIKYNVSLILSPTAMYPPVGPYATAFRLPGISIGTDIICSL